MTAAQPDQTPELTAQRIGESLAESLADRLGVDPASFADALGTADEATTYRALGRIVVDLTDGWRPPARVIETDEQLAALPYGVIVRSEMGTIAARYDQTRGVCFGDERSFPWVDLSLPATIVWEPTDA